jgi:hypothetical protein
MLSKRLGLANTSFFVDDDATEGGGKDAAQAYKASWHTFSKECSTVT